MSEVRITGKISPEEVQAFLRAVRSGPVFAVALINRDLDDAVPINRLFSGGLGYELHATPLRAGEYRIRFGCQTTQEKGDGGEWIVRYDERGAVRSVTPVSQWVS